ncbi:WapI family immunity protein [Sutcliffiella halmapala]
MKFHLLGEETKIEIDVLHRNYPNSSDYWDGNWVKSKIKIEIPGYLVRFDADLRTDELRDFVNEIKLLNRSLKGIASLKNLDSYLQFECQMGKLGQMLWTAETCYPAGYGAVLKFEFESDQTFLNRLIRELDDILTHFPVIGKP